MKLGMEVGLRPDTMC